VIRERLSALEARGCRKERHAIRDGWRSVAPSRIHLVHETAGTSELPALAFTTD
jgi:hypothetical protein